MLLTTCPNCAAQFKVLTEQLNVRHGRVMCGRCRQVFDAFQSLTRGPDTTGPHVPLDAGRKAAQAPAPAEPPMIGEANFVLEDLDRQDADHGALARSEPPFKAVAPQMPAPTGNPLLRADARPQAGGGQAIWLLGAVVLGVTLLGQATYAFRSELAQTFPAARPWLKMACGHLSCEVPFGRDNLAIRIEASDLIELPGRNGRFQATATISNRGKQALDYPMLELRLTDNANQVLLARALTPSEYLGRETGRDDSIAPGAEVYVNLVAETTAKVPASGYAVRAYYP